MNMILQITHEPSLDWDSSGDTKVYRNREGLAIVEGDQLYYRSIQKQGSIREYKGVVEKNAKTGVLEVVYYENGFRTLAIPLANCADHFPLPL